MPKLSDCTACPLHSTATQAVAGKGPVPCDIMLVAEAPGYEEDRRGEPFVGRSGQRLDALLKLAGLQRKDVYITNLVKHRPPQNRNPLKGEIAACSVWLEQEIASVQPKLIITLGRFAATYFKPDCKLSKDHGLLAECRFGAWNSGIQMIPMYHPAASLHDPRKLPEITYDFERLGEYLRSGAPNAVSAEYALVSAEQSAELALQYTQLGFDLETTSPKRRKWFAAEQAEVIGYSLAGEPLRACYVAEKPTHPLLVAVLESIAVEKVAHNSKFEYAKLKQLGITLRNFKDTKIEAALLQYPDTSLKSLARQVLGVDPITYADVTQGRDMDEVPVEEIVPYAAADADNALRIHWHFDKQLDALGLQQLYETVELPLVPVIVDMELHGILVDEVATTQLHERMKLERELLAVQLVKMLNVDNPASIDQVAVALEKLGAPLQQRTPAKGQLVVNDDVLMQARPWNPLLVDTLLDFRRTGKRASFLRNFLELRGTDGRLHPAVHQAGSYEEGSSANAKEAPATGRLAYSGPNLQQIPHRGDPVLIAAMRDCLIAEPGKLLLCADVSQEEARILSYVSQDQQMLADFASGQPIYGFIGQELYGRSVEKDSDPKEWFVSKTFFLAFVYGADYDKLLEIDRAFGNGTLTLSVARQGARRLSARYPMLARYRQAVHEQVREEYRLRDYMGRLRDFPALGSDNSADRQEAHRQAFNFTIQGPAASVMKKAMRSIWQELPADCHLLMSIHDEVVLEVPPAEVDSVAALCYNAFQNVMPVSLPVEFSVGASWGSVKRYVRLAAAKI